MDQLFKLINLIKILRIKTRLITQSRIIYFIKLKLVQLTYVIFNGKVKNKLILYLLRNNWNARRRERQRQGKEKNKYIFQKIL